TAAGNRPGSGVTRRVDFRCFATVASCAPTGEPPLARFRWPYRPPAPSALHVFGSSSAHFTCFPGLTRTPGVDGKAMCLAENRRQLCGILLQLLFTVIQPLTQVMRHLLLLGDGQVGFRIAAG